MVNQEQICLKIDASLLLELNTEVYVSGIKRNRAINDAIRLYIKIRDTQRYLRTTHDQELQKADVEKFCRDVFPQAYAWPE